MLPVRYELERLASPYIKTISGNPAKINRLLAEGELDLAPCSSVCLVASDSRQLAMPLGVVAKGKVKSVYLGFQHEHGELIDKLRVRHGEIKQIIASGLIKYPGDMRSLGAFIWKHALALQPLPIELAPPLKLTSASATSAMLSKVLYRLWFGDEVFRMQLNRMQAGISLSTQAAIELVIGDEALARKAQFYRTIDLGGLWHELSGLPFVFAAWQSSTMHRSRLAKQIIETVELAEAKMRVEPTVYLPQNPPVCEKGRKIDLADYWKHIYYRIGPQELRGLLLFLSLVKDLLNEQQKHDAILKLSRWQLNDFKTNGAVSEHS